MAHLPPVVPANSGQRKNAELLIGEALTNFGGCTESALVGVAMDAIVLLEAVDPELNIDEGAITPLEIQGLNDVLDSFPSLIIDKSRKNLGM